MTFAVAALSPQLVFPVVALLASLACAVTDMRTGKMPNVITLGTLAAAPLLHFALAASSGGLSAGLLAAGTSVLGALLCTVVPAILYRAGGLGGGDLKLFAALGALLHPVMGIEAQLYACIAAALYAPARMAYEGRLFAVLGNTVALVANPLLPKARQRPVRSEMLTWMRMGPFIFVGVALEALLSIRG